MIFDSSLYCFISFIKYEFEKSKLFSSINLICFNKKVFIKLS